MTTLTHSDLDDLRRNAEAALERGYWMVSEWVSPKDHLDLLDHIAQLTAERDEAQTTVERERQQAEELRRYFEESLRSDFEEELRSARARITELEAQSSAPFTAGKLAGFWRAHKIVETFGRLAVVGNPSEHPWTRGYVTACSDLASDISRAIRDEVELKG